MMSLSCIFANIAVAGCGTTPKAKHRLDRGRAGAHSRSMDLPAATAPIEHLARLVLDAVLPPRCLACGGGVDHQGTLCATCWSRLTFIAPPWCACCRMPFEFT